MTTCVDVINKALALLALDPISATVISSGITTSDPDSRGIPDTDDINDDDLSTGVSTTTEVQSLNPYTVVHFDLGSEQNLAYVNIFGLKVSSGSSDEFYLQYSSDDTYWTALGRHLDVDTTARLFVRNGPISARYLRLARIGSADMGTAVVTLAEIDAYTFGSNDKDSTCRTLYATCRDMVFAHHPWRDGIFKKRLTKLSGTPVNEWDYWYELPIDMETSGPRALFLTSGDRKPNKEWELASGKLLCNHDTIYTSKESGTATAGAATTLTDSAKSWTVNAYTGQRVRITGGTGKNQIRVVLSNTDTALTITPAWNTAPSTDSAYEIVDDANISAGVYIDYQTQLDEGEMPAHVGHLLVLAMASLLAEPLTDQTSKMETWERQAWGSPGDEGSGGYSRQARRIESQNKPSEAIVDYSLVDVRYGP